MLEVVGLSQEQEESDSQLKHNLNPSDQPPQARCPWSAQDSVRAFTSEEAR